MNITVIGSGYVGLITSLCFSARGNHVKCVDINEKIVSSINKGDPHIFEEGLENLLIQQLKTGRFIASSSLSESIINSEIIFIAVGTPSTEKGEINLQYIKNVSKEIGKLLSKIEKNISIVVKSTVLPTTTDTLVRSIIERESGKSLQEFGLGMNPEFLREGSAINDFMNPDRIVMGYEDSLTKNRLEKLYKDWQCDKLYVNTRTAELIKYANNALLALQISATNEIANLAKKVEGIDIEEVMNGIHLDNRWNPIKENNRVFPGILNYLKAGCGFGGSCFPKDVKAITNFADNVGYKMRICESIVSVNNDQPLIVVQDLKKYINLSKANILILGLAFKENTDDVRESPAIKIINDLILRGSKVFAHDPLAIKNFQKVVKPNINLIYTEDWKKYISICNVIIIVTNWKEYSKIVHFDLSQKIIYDSRRFLKKDKIKNGKYLTI